MRKPAGAAPISHYRQGKKLAGRGCRWSNGDGCVGRPTVRLRRTGRARGDAVAAVLDKRVIASITLQCYPGWDILEGQEVTAILPKCCLVVTYLFPSSCSKRSAVMIMTS